MRQLNLRFGYYLFINPTIDLPDCLLNNKPRMSQAGAHSRYKKSEVFEYSKHNCCETFQVPYSAEDTRWGTVETRKQLFLNWKHHFEENF